MWMSLGRGVRTGGARRCAAAVMVVAALAGVVGGCGSRQPVAINQPPVFNPPSPRTVTVLPGDTL